jgi:hypothetical protein
MLRQLSSIFSSSCAGVGAESILLNNNPILWWLIISKRESKRDNCVQFINTHAYGFLLFHFSLKKRRIKTARRYPAESS